MGNVYLNIQQQAAILKKSISQWIADYPTGYLPYPTALSDLKYNDKMSEEYTDPFYSIDLVSTLFPNFAASKWYNRQELFKFWVIGKYSF